MKYLSFALIIVSVSAVPITGFIAGAVRDRNVNISGWSLPALFIVFISAVAMFH